VAVSGGPVVFLDKDGTIIEDLPYNVDPTRIRLAPGSDRGLRRLGAAGFGVAVITNQSGVARGYFTLDELGAVHRHLDRLLAERGVPLLGFYACPHLPEGVNEFACVCDCRKPRTGLIERAARELGVQPRDCWMAGDTWMDVAAGREAGCRTILLGPEAGGASRLPVARRPDVAVRDLDEAAAIIIASRPVLGEHPARTEGVTATTGSASA
jgi:histidinol-phosphate phosphatase family protein